MKKINLYLMVLLLSLGWLQSVQAITIGFSVSSFNDNFITVLRNKVKAYGDSMGYKIQILDANDDIGKQLSQVQNFIASGVDAIMVHPIDTDSTSAMTKAAEKAGIPLVYINRKPADLKKFTKTTAYVGSIEHWSGTLEALEVCKLAKGKGRAVMLMGQLNNEAARSRSAAVREVLKLSVCKGIKLIAEQTANWQRVQANDLMTNWLSADLNFNIVFANNDEMAIGAIQAMKAAGINMKDVVVGGIDATVDALSAMKKGDLDVTVFQNGTAQGIGGVKTAVKLIKGQSVPKYVIIPFELVTPENMDKYAQKN